MKYLLPAVLAFSQVIALLPHRLLAESMVIANAGGGTDDRGVLLTLDTETGIRQELSDFGDPELGPLGLNMTGVVEARSGEILVVDPFTNWLFTVDAATGAREILSNFADFGQGPTGSYPAALALETEGTILVSDSAAEALFRIDPASGHRVVLSDFTDSFQGPGSSPSDLTVGIDGRIWVAGQLEGAGNLGAIFEIDPSTGVRTLLSDFGNSAQGEVAFLSSIVASTTAIFAVSSSANAVFQVDAGTGLRIKIADFWDAADGTVYDFRPVSLAIDRNGLLQVIGHSVSFGGFDLVISVDPQTGERTLLSELAAPSQGATASAPTAIAPIRRSLFEDGFENGNTNAWSSVAGLP